MTKPEPKKPEDSAESAPSTEPGEALAQPEPAPRPRLEPTRYGDWELNGKCVDF